MGEEGERERSERSTQAASDGEEGRERTSRSAASERDAPGDELHHAEDGDGANGEVAGEDAVDVVVADAEGTRDEVPANADHDGADGRPPHPVDGEVLESVLDPVDCAGHAQRHDADEGAEDDVGDERRGVGLPQIRHGEGRRRPDESDAYPCCRCRRQADRDERPRPELEE